MNTTDVSKATKFRVGMFTLLGVALVGALTVFVNDRPFWWRSCQPVYISVEDATGLKTKSPIKSLGIQVGYLKSIELAETRVKLGICLTANVEVTPETRAYIRGEGFLGDKFVELKPMKYLGGERAINSVRNPSSQKVDAAPAQDEPKSEEQKELEKHLQGEETTQGPGLPVEVHTQKREVHPTKRIFDLMFPSASADMVSTANAADIISNANAEDGGAKEVPVGKRGGDMDKLLESADKLIGELTDLTKNLKEGLNPKELKETIQALNKMLQNASKALSPEGGLNGTARKALEKLDDAFEQLRQQITRINHGEGSLGKIINDPVYADELLKAAKSINKLLDKTVDVRFRVNLGAEQIPQYNGSRGFFQLAIWPRKDRYYLIGISLDPRGKRSVSTTTTTAGGSSATVEQETNEETGFILTGMLGKLFFNRLDLAAGALHGDGCVSSGLYLGPAGSEEQFQLKADFYTRGKNQSVNERVTLTAFPFYRVAGMSGAYVKGGIETFKKVNGHIPWMFGAGIAFDDEDIKLLFAFK